MHDLERTTAALGHDPRRYWNRRLASTWSLQGVGLRGSSRAYNRWLYGVRHRVFRRIVRSLELAPGARVLEIGPGVGFYTRRWLRLGARVTAVDIADSAIDRLAPRFPSANFRQADVTDPFADLGTGHDVAWAFDVLFHVVDDDAYRQAFVNVHAALRDGGWFVFTESCARQRSQPMRHYVRRSFAETEAALHEAGFEIVDRRPAFILMLNPFDGPRWRRRLWGRLSTWTRREVPGALLGALLYGPELLLTKLRRTGPTTEVLVCRKSKRIASAS